jgi:hypothetical protein
MDVKDSESIGLVHGLNHMWQALVGTTDMGSVLPTGTGIVQKIHRPRDLASEILQDHEQVF